MISSSTATARQLVSAYGMADIEGQGAVGPTLLLFTESYPYDVAVEETFIAPQLLPLREAFARLVLVPSSRVGRRLEVPDGVEVDESLAIKLGPKSARIALIARASVSRLFWRDIAERPSILTSRQALKLLVRTSGRAEITRLWLKAFFQRYALPPAQSVAYTFWCDHATAGLALVKIETEGLIVVSRVNGADLYAERHNPPYLPCRHFTLMQLDRLFAVSEHARRYVVEHYPWFATRCEVARLGVADPGFVNHGSANGRYVLVSCSSLVPVKRVDRILAGVAAVARLRPELQFEWHHFGDGDHKADLVLEATATLPANAKAHFHGHVSPNEIMKFYRTEPVDAFLNASSSEGGAPVAIMEAASCGIPVIATAVGGNPEIVSDRNGALVGPDPTPEEFSEALMDLIDHPDEADAKRAESRRVWELKYRAIANYTEFAHRLVELREHVSNI